MKGHKISRVYDAENLKKITMTTFLIVESSGSSRNKDIRQQNNYLGLCGKWDYLHIICVSTVYEVWSSRVQ